MATELTIQGMTCEGCERIIEDALENVSGVNEAEADRHERTVAVEGDAEPRALVEAVDMAGYEAET